MSVNEELLASSIMTRRQHANELDAERREDKRHTAAVRLEVRPALERLDALDWSCATLEKVVVRKALGHDSSKYIELAQVRGEPFVGDLSNIPFLVPPLWLGKDGLMYEINDGLFDRWANPRTPPFMPYKRRYFDRAFDLIWALRQLGTSDILT